MNALEAQAALEIVFGGTTCRVDRARASIGLSWARQHGLLDVARRQVMAKRAEHLRWLTVTQRKWQADTRRPGRARHHDSIAIRERFVRCAI